MASTANQFKVTWDTPAKDYQQPVGTDAQKAVILKLDSKYEGEDLSFNGLGYFCKVNDNHWVIGASELQLKPPVAKLPNGKITDGNFKADATIEQAWLQQVEHNKFCYACCVDGHAGAEKLVELLDGKLAILDFKLLTKDAAKVEEAVKAILDDSDPEPGVFGDVFSILTEEAYENFKDHKQKLLKIKPIIEEGKPVIIPFLPAVKSSGYSKSGYGSKPGFLATADRVKELIAFKEDANFQALYEWFTQEPEKVNFALALTGATPFPLSNIVNFPITAKEVEEVKEAQEEKK